jgi:Orsellinic acid/F9775 biosynthesis cluster protein D
VEHNSTEVDGGTRATFSLPLRADHTYNLAICTDCCASVPFDWIETHMKDNHGLKCNDQQTLEYLDILTPTMKSDEFQAWLANNQVIRKPIEGIPVIEGVGCSLCSYSAKKRTVLYNHISNAHKGENPRAMIVGCKIQKLSRGRFKNCIQVESEDEAEDESVDNWKSNLDREFSHLVEEHSQIENNGSLDLKLINAFVAKSRYKAHYLINIRWDVHLANVNTQNLAKLVEVPTIKDPLHRLIMCGRRYIRECCKKLSGGNMIIRRSLMIAK